MSISPVLSADSSREPPRIRKVPSINGSSWSSCRNTISPLGNSTRFGSCGWNWCNGGMGICFHEVAPFAFEDDVFSGLPDEGFFAVVWAIDKEREQASRRRKAEIRQVFVIIAVLLYPRLPGLVAARFRSSRLSGSRH